MGDAAPHNLATVGANFMHGMGGARLFDLKDAVDRWADQIDVMVLH